MKKKTGNIKYKSVVIYITLSFFFQFFTHAQENILERQITADFKNIRLNDAFRQIEKQLSVYFTFDGSLINTNKKINQSFKGTPLNTCLDLLIEDSTLFYKVIENHIVIRCCKHFEDTNIDSVIKPVILSIKGKVFDKTNKEVLPFASIGIKGKSLSVVSNNNGEFILKIPPEMQNDELCVACMGYSNMCFPVSELIGKTKDFAMERNYIPIQEVIIRKTDAKNLIRTALKNIPKNYAEEPVYLTGFYRESVNKSSKYMFYSEAVMQIYKSGYKNTFEGDMIKILKSRKMQDISLEDTIIVKFKSGLQASIGMDIVRNQSEFIDEANFNQYKYIMSDIVSIDNLSAYLIEFEPLEYEQEALYEGKIYIDIEDMAIVGCEFQINKKRIGSNQNLFIAKKDKGINIKMSKISYNVSYRKIGDKYFLNYVSGDINMRVRKKAKLFYFDFDISFEMAISEIETNGVERFKRKEAARLETIFFDEIYTYDEEFWENYNFIKPDKPLQKTIEKVKD